MKAHPFTAKVTRYVENAPPLVKQMAENKRYIQAYLCGEIAKEALEKRGIKLAAPL